LITVPGQEGEMVCISPAIMMGYAETANDLAHGDVMQGRLVTGDLATRDADGLFRITGRKSRFLKLHGNRVGLDDVEQFIRRHGHNGACVGIDNWLCVVLEGADEEATTALRHSMIGALSFPPRSFEVRSLPQLPRSSSGKLRYKDLLDIVRMEQRS
jgi:long-chain acyl-CoA synthetase